MVAVSTETAFRRKPTRSGNKKLGQRLPADHLVVKPAVEQRRGSQGLQDPRTRYGAADLSVSGLGALPSSISYSELYSALQTHIIEGQENPLAQVSTGKLYEVQKYCALSNHCWSGYWIVANRRALSSLPADLVDIVTAISMPRRSRTRRFAGDGPIPAGRACRQGHDIQQARSCAIQGGAGQGELLHAVAEDLRRRGWARLEQYNRPLT